MSDSKTTKEKRNLFLKASKVKKKKLAFSLDPEE